MKVPTKDALRRELAQAQRELLRAEGRQEAYRDVAMNRGSGTEEERPRRLLRRVK